MRNPGRWGMPWERVALTVQAREQRRVTYKEIGPSVLDAP